MPSHCSQDCEATKFTHNGPRFEVYGLRVEMQNMVPDAVCCSPGCEATTLRHNESRFEGLTWVSDAVCCAASTKAPSCEVTKSTQSESRFEG